MICLLSLRGENVNTKQGLDPEKKNVNFPHAMTAKEFFVTILFIFVSTGWFVLLTIRGVNFDQQIVRQVCVW